MAGMALVECAASVGRASGAGGGVDGNEMVRLCLRAIHRLGAAGGGGDGGTAGAAPAAGDVLAQASDREPAGAQPFAEAALEFTCGVVEREWVGKRGEMGQHEGDNGQEVGKHWSSWLSWHDEGEEEAIACCSCSIALARVLTSTVYSSTPVCCSCRISNDTDSNFVVTRR